MQKAATYSTTSDRSAALSRNVALVIGASLVIAICARISVPLPFTPVPLTLANFGVLAVGLLLGSKRGFAAAALYLSYGMAGLPVFSTVGFGGIAQLLGPTGGYLWAYPVVAFIAGYIAERGTKSFTRSLVAATAGLAGFVPARSMRVSGPRGAPFAAKRRACTSGVPVALALIHAIT